MPAPVRSRPPSCILRTATIFETGMALVWRLVRPEFASDLDGKGNVNRGARWNSPGRGVVYASFNLSLCVLESFVQLPIAAHQSAGDGGCAN
jgi:RES domain-containing protein